MDSGNSHIAKETALKTFTVLSVKGPDCLKFEVDGVGCGVGGFIRDWRNTL